MVLHDGDSLEEMFLLEATLTPLLVVLLRCIGEEGEVKGDHCRDVIEDPFVIPFCKFTRRMIVTDGVELP